MGDFLTEFAIGLLVFTLFTVLIILYVHDTEPEKVTTSYDGEVVAQLVCDKEYVFTPEAKPHDIQYIIDKGRIKCGDIIIDTKLTSEQATRLDSDGKCRISHRLARNKVMLARQRICLSP